jgi:hypothetical protein
MKNVIITIFTLTTLNRMCKEVPKLKRKFAEADRVIEKIHSLKEEYLIKVDEQLASLTYKFITTELPHREYLTQRIDLIATKRYIETW